MELTAREYEKQEQLLRGITLPFGQIDEVEYCPAKEHRAFLTARFYGYDSLFAVHMTLHSEPRSNIKVTLGLPLTNWNGKLLCLGNGGAAGRTGTSDVLRGVSLGYATAHTDMGTEPEPYDCIGNFAALEDFGHRATHLMTIAAKQITTAFYGTEPAHCYFSGGSTGGQQALMQAQRYPEDHDGIVCYHPAHDRVALHTQFAWNRNLMNEGGQPQFTSEELDAIYARLVEAYAERCGAAPGEDFLPYPDQIGEMDFSIFCDEKMKTPLTAHQIELLKKIYAGPSDPVTGTRIYEGMTVGAETQSLSLKDMIKPAEFTKMLMFPFYWAYGNTMGLEFDFHADYLRAHAELSPILDATSIDLRPFAARGGKLLLIHGTNDAAIPYQSSTRYYRQVIEQMGGLSNTTAFFRYFLVPGLAHGIGGAGVQSIGQLDYTSVPRDALHDPIVALDRWVCDGTAPEKLLSVAFENGDLLGTKIEKERPVYPYPYRTKYRSGDPSEPDAYEPIL